jgi:hypothetical protein
MKAPDFCVCHQQISFCDSDHTMSHHVRLVPSRFTGLLTTDCDALGVTRQRISEIRTLAIVTGDIHLFSVTWNF